MLKEYRCTHCNKLFFKADIQYATVEIKCKYCKNISTIKGDNCSFLLLANENNLPNYNDSISANFVNCAIDKCEKCSQFNNCKHYEDMKVKGVCPLCKSFLS
jgi:phage FluMu protein Com